MSVFSGLAAKFVKGFEDVKAVIIEAANAAPGIIQKIEGYEPEVVALASLVVPGAGAVASAANTVLEAVVSVLSAGGASAEQNFLAAGLDQATINAAKAVVAVFEAEIKKA